VDQQPERLTESGVDKPHVLRSVKIWVRCSKVTLAAREFAWLVGAHVGMLITLDNMLSDSRNEYASFHRLAS
jgi:hypothetical protein